MEYPRYRPCCARSTPYTQRECSEELERYRVWLHDLLTKLAPDKVAAELLDCQANLLQTQNSATCGGADSLAKSGTNLLAEGLRGIQE
jgi:hypothetical protein